jgi:O-antigen/teichoic acid export membrane protein
VGIYYARVLGTNLFGSVTVIQAIMVYFTMAALLGLQTYGTREISKNIQKVDAIVGEIISMRLAASIFCFILILILTFFINKNYEFKLLLILYGITVFPSALNLDWVFMGTQEMQHNAVYNILKNLIPFVFIFLFLKTEQQVMLIPIFTFIGLLIGFLYQLFIYKRIDKFKFHLRFNRSKAVQYVKFGMPFLISGILAMINCNVDRIIIEFTRTEGEAGVYSSAYYIILFLTNVVTIIFTPAFPQLISFYNENNKKALQKLTGYLSKIVVMICVPAAAGGIVLSKEIILLLFGKEYIQAYIPFSILMIYILMLFIRELYGYGLNAWGMEKKYLNIVLISSLVNLVLNLIFTPVYGMNIAAVITVASEVINLVLMRKYALKVTDINNLENIAKVLIPTAFMTLIIVILKYLSVNTVVIILSAILVYFISIFVFKYIKVEEVKSILIKKNEV